MTPFCNLFMEQPSYFVCPFYSDNCVIRYSAVNEVRHVFILQLIQDEMGRTYCEANGMCVVIVSTLPYFF